MRRSCCFLGCIVCTRNYACIQKVSLNKVTADINCLFLQSQFQQWITVQAFPTPQTTEQLLFQNKALHVVPASQTQSQQCSWGGTKACLVLAGLIDQCSGWLYTTYRPGFLQFKEEGLLQEPLDDLLYFCLACLLGPTLDWLLLQGTLTDWRCTCMVLW